MQRPILVFTQGDPAGIGPELLARVATEEKTLAVCQPVLILERAALAGLADLPGLDLGRFSPITDMGQLPDLDAGLVPYLDPLALEGRRITPGQPGLDDAKGALAALDLGAELVMRGVGNALVTAPVSKAQIARHLEPDFRGHTDYLAQKAGLSRYGRDYLMAFLAPGLRVALLSTHIPLEQAIAHVSEESLIDALRCLSRVSKGKIAVAGLDPHAGEGGLLGHRDRDIVAPAVQRARAEGIDVYGPESADSLFSRARHGAFEWVLALYHDQGLIAVKTAAFGEATNWTVGLPYLRTSVDHGTAYDIAGQGKADPSSLRAVIDTTLELVMEESASAGASDG